MKKLLNLFKPRTTDAPKQVRGSNDFQFELGEMEKHHLELAFNFPLTAKVDGLPATSKFERSHEAGKEVYHAWIGRDEISSVRVERIPGILLKSRIRVFVNGRLVEVLKGRRRQPSRQDVVRRTVLPGLFLLLVTYYAFVQQPDVIKFYCSSFWNIEQKQQPSKKRVAYSEPVHASFPEIARPVSCS